MTYVYPSTEFSAERSGCFVDDGIFWSSMNNGLVPTNNLRILWRLKNELCEFFLIVIILPVFFTLLLPPFHYESTMTFMFWRSKFYYTRVFPNDFCVFWKSSCLLKFTAHKSKLTPAGYKSSQLSTERQLENRMTASSEFGFFLWWNVFRQCERERLEERET